jgi:hypothetical protein
MHCNLSSAVLATGVAALLTVGCGSKSGLRDGGGNPGTGGAAGATQTGGNAGNGGGPGAGGNVGSGGNPASGGITGGGGSPGTGGGTQDAALGVPCADDGGVGLPAAARRCTLDSDCTIAIAARCCGSDQALGEAKSQANTYASCLALPPGACASLGCAKFLGYSTDTGRTTPIDVSSSQPINLVSVRCSSQLCTTDVVETEDGGRDVAPAMDVSPDATRQTCGDALCGSGQACVLTAGGARPPCSDVPEAGPCPAGLVVTALCSDPSTGVDFHPGCTTPAPTPQCVPLADGCGDVCSCVCPTGGSAGCFMGPGYTICSMP